MSKFGTQWHVLLGVLVLWFAGGCIFKDAKLKRDLDHLLQSLPEPPNSVLLSEIGKLTGGSDSRCDGYLISRLYGTDEPIESIIRFVEQKILSQDQWSLNPTVPNNQTMIGLIHKGGYGLGVNEIELREELLRDPFFNHTEVSLNQPYQTVFLFNVRHIDPSQVKHCWGVSPQ